MMLSMLSTQTENFWDIVQKEMDARGIKSYRALESAGGVSNGTISQRARDLLPPTRTTISAIAIAMGVPESIVREWSKGHHASDDSVTRRELMYLFEQLSDDDRKRIVQIARTFASARAEQPGGQLGEQEPATA